MAITKPLDTEAEALEQLEQQLEVPYVSGQLHAWSETVVELAEKAQEAVRMSIEQEHPCTFATIVKSHSNLQTQVEQLREEDRQILPAFDPLLHEARQFAATVNETELARQQIEPARERLVKDGLALVIRVRRQRSAIETWLGEALQRDNGVGD